MSTAYTMSTLNTVAAMIERIRNLPHNERETVLSRFTAGTSADAVECALFYALEDDDNE